MRTFILTFLLFTINTYLVAQAPFGSAGVQTEVLKSQNTSGFGYYEYLPQDFDEESGKEYKAVIFLHGLGENGNGGTELNKVLRSGPPKYVEAGEHFDGIIISPQHDSEHWSDCFSVGEVKSIYDFIVANYPVDINNINLTGLSCGSIGGFYTIRDHPTLFNRALMIAGNANSLSIEYPDFLTEYDTEIWMVHGRSDNTVNSWNSINPAQTLDGIEYTIPSGDFNKEFNGTEWVDFTEMPTQQLALTLYDGVGHNSWARTYSGSAGLKAMEWIIGRVELVTATNGVDAQEVLPKVVPNPTTGLITLQNLPTETASITITDTRGNVVSTENDVNLNQALDLSYLTRGIYFINVITLENSWTLKTVVEDK